MQDKLKVAVLGARGIGKYHAREFHKAGAHIVAVLGRTGDSSSAAASKLNGNFGINASPYSSLEELIQKEHPNIVSIATSNDSHYGYAITALNSGCHVFLEKPILWSGDHNTVNHIQKAEQLFQLADEKKVILTVNTQLVWHLDKYIEAIKIKSQNMKFRDFKARIMTTYPVRMGVNPAVDLLPHALCFLTRLDYNGKIDWNRFEITKDGAIYRIKFAYNYREDVVNVDIQIGHGRPYPSVVFGFDNLKVKRVERKSEDSNCINYELIGIENDLRIETEDPLSVSVRSFYKAAQNNDKTRLLASPQEALANFTMQCEIMQRRISIEPKSRRYMR